MNAKLKELLLRVLILLGGLTVAHLGVTLFLLSDLGADPFNVFIQGLYRTLEKRVTHPLLTHGNVHICVSLLILLALLFIDKSYIRVGTLLCMVFGGPIIDVFTLLLQPLFAAPGLPFRLAAVTAGCVILAFGMSLVIRSEAGTGPNDLVAVVISDKSRRKFGIVRVVVDISFIAAGFALGGQVGVGTVICACLVGPVAGFFLPKSGRIVQYLLKK